MQSPLRYNLSRKQKYNGEDTSSNKGSKVPDTKQHHHLNSLEMLHKMAWLQNQNDNDLERYFFILIESRIFV
jgi:hypothetical protein